MIEWLDKLRIAVGERRYAYRATFNAPTAQPVLKDLARFCRADKSTFHDNERVHLILEGRKQVWLHIQNHLHLSPAELFDIYSKGADVSQ